MISLFFLFIINFSVVRNLYVPVVTTETNAPEEIQHAICKISSKKLEATANATITRQLKGVCTSREFNEKMEALQSKIDREIGSVKRILEFNGFKMPEIKVEHFEDNTKSLNEKIVLKRIAASRADEILLYNDTVRDITNGSIYLYYWNIQDVRNLLAKVDMYKSSPEFSVLGHSLYLQLFPNHLEKNYFAIKLRPTSRGFLKKHKISILNQYKDIRDIDSGTLFGRKGDASLFRLSADSIQEEGFIVDNSMVVKIEIFLNS